MGIDTQGNFAHFGGAGHFQMHARVQGGRYHLHIPVLNVPSVFTQMYYYSAGSGQFSQMGCGDRFRFFSHALLAQGGNMININNKHRHVSLLNIFLHSQKSLPESQASVFKKTGPPARH
jgi:hypothetical protein